MNHSNETNQICYVRRQTQLETPEQQTDPLKWTEAACVCQILWCNTLMAPPWQAPPSPSSCCNTCTSPKYDTFKVRQCNARTLNSRSYSTINRIEYCYCDKLNVMCTMKFQRLTSDGFRQRVIIFVFMQSSSNTTRPYKLQIDLLSQQTKHGKKAIVRIKTV